MSNSQREKVKLINMAATFALPQNPLFPSSFLPFTKH